MHAILFDEAATAENRSHGDFREYNKKGKVYISIKFLA